MKWATRPSAVVREAPIFLYFMSRGLREAAVIPLDREKSEYYVDQTSYGEVLQLLLKEMRQDPERHLQGYKECRGTLIRKARAVERNLSAGGETLWTSYDEYYQFKMGVFSRYLIDSFAVDEILLPHLRATFPGYVDAITRIGTPIQYQQMLLMLASHAAEDVRKRYGWLNVYNYKEDDYPLNHFTELKDEAGAHAHQMLKNIEKNENEFQEFIATVHDPVLRRDCILAHTYAFIKTDRVDCWKEAMSYVRGLFRKLAQKGGWTIEEAINLTQQEIRRILLEGVYPTLDEVKRRSSKQCIFHFTPHGMEIVYDPGRIQQLRGRVQHVFSSSVKGVAVSQGIARGRVTLVTDKSHLPNVTQGDVLVAIYTTPEYLPAIMRAAAIVTDEGGMTSHAAVLSREMGKPCIVGTNNATRVLKDGDLVEVDADSGTVRKLP